MPSCRWVLIFHGFVVKLSPYEAKGVNPNFGLEIGAEVCMTEGAICAARRIVAALDALGVEQVAGLKPSRVDLCVDCPGLSVAWIWDVLDSGRLVGGGRSGQINPRFHWSGKGEKVWESVNFGSRRGKGVFLRIYEKRHEVISKKLEDCPKYELLYRDRWHGELPERFAAARVEFELHRDVLKQLGVDTLDDLEARVGGVAGYLTTKWVRVHDNPPDRRNGHYEGSIDPVWRAVQAAFRRAFDDSEPVRREPVKPSRGVYARVKQGLGCLAGAALIAKGETDEPFGLASLMEYILQVIRDPGIGAAQTLKDAAYRLLGQGIEVPRAALGPPVESVPLDRR
jgi:hypothetical protein